MKRWLLIIGAVGVVAIAAVLFFGRDAYVWWRYERKVPLDAAVLEEPTIGGDQALVVADGTGGARPLLLFMHGYAEDREAVMLPRTHSFTQDLVDAGWVVASSDAGGNAWGSPASQDAYVTLYEWVADRFDVSDVVIMSESMGAIAGLNVVADDRIPHVAAWVGVSPVIDLARAASTAPLADILAEDVPAGQIAEVDPSAIDPATLAGVPLLIYLAEDDRIISNDDARTFAASTGAEVRPCEGEHVARDCYRAGDVLALVG